MNKCKWIEMFYRFVMAGLFTTNVDAENEISAIAIVLLAAVFLLSAD